MKKLVIGIFVFVFVALGIVTYIFWDDFHVKKLTRSSFSLNESPDIFAPLRFEELQQINPDIHAWIYIPGTNIDNPIVQSPTDNSYYLGHSLYGEEDANGAIFTENYNAKDFSDYIVGVYGSSFEENIGFYDLYKYVDKAYMEKNNFLLIYLPGKVLKYRIFAAYIADGSHVVLSYDKGTERYMREYYLDDIMGQRSMNAIIDRDTSVNYDSKILTLSTNYKNDNNFRFLLQSYLEEILE